MEIKKQNGCTKEEKIKEGKKLTTDDFLAFQEIIKNKNDAQY